MGISKRISLVEAIPKIRSYCDYRERCHKEVREKLYQLGLWKKDVDLAIMQMMDENLLNEERYATSFARGHFYNKKWGKYKITVELKKRYIHDRLIKTSLLEINEEDYQMAIDSIIKKKSKEYKGNKYEIQQKVNRYLVSRGYSHNDFGSKLREHFNKRT